MRERRASGGVSGFMRRAVLACLLVVLSVGGAMLTRTPRLRSPVAADFGTPRMLPACAFGSVSVAHVACRGWCQDTPDSSAYVSWNAEAAFVGTDGHERPISRELRDELLAELLALTSVTPGSLPLRLNGQFMVGGWCEEMHFVSEVVGLHLAWNSVREHPEVALEALQQTWRTWRYRQVLRHWQRLASP